MLLTTHTPLVPWSRKSKAIPQHPLCSVRPVQSLSACTVQLYLYSPYVPYGLYRASVPVQYSYTSTPHYEPYTLYRTSVPVQYSYTSTTTIGRTACTEPQCLYNTAISLLPPMGRTAFTEPQCLYSTAIPLLPLWTVRTVQRLSACIVNIYDYSPYGPYGLYRASVPV